MHALDFFRPVMKVRGVLTDIGPAASSVEVSRVASSAGRSGGGARGSGSSPRTFRRNRVSISDGGVESSKSRRSSKMVEL